MKKILLLLTLIASVIITAHTQTAEEWIQIAETAEQEGRLADAGAARSNAGHVQKENGDFNAAAENFERAAEHFESEKRDAQANAERTNAADAHEQAAIKAVNKGHNKEAARQYEEAAKQWEKADRSGNAENARAHAKYYDEHAAAAPPDQTRFSLSLGGILPFGGITPQQVQYGDLEQAIYAPGTMAQLFEKLNGEFFIGELTGHPSKVFEMSGKTQTMPGLRLGLRLGKGFELRAGGHYFQTNWSGNFPVVVLSGQQGPPLPTQTLQGTLAASSSGVMADAGLAYFFTNGTVRPFVQAGIHGQFPTQNEGGATLAGVALPLETTPLGSSFSPFGGAGIRVGFLKNGFVEAGGSYGKVPGGEYAPSVNLGLGWRFGGPPGETVPIEEEEEDKMKEPENCTVCLENGDCGCGDISFDLLVTHYSLQIQNDGKKNERSYNVKQPVKTAVKEDSQSGVGKDKEQDPAEIKSTIKGLKADDEVGISLTNVKIDCPCTNGTACEAYKSDLPNTKAGQAEQAKIGKAIAADAALGKANEEVVKIEDELDKANTDLAKKNANNKLKKAKEKVAKLEKELKVAQEDLAKSGLGNPNIKINKKDASGSWDTPTGVFTFDKNGDYGLKVDKVPFVFEFEISFHCQSFKCDGVRCIRKFKITVDNK